MNPFAWSRVVLEGTHGAEKTALSFYRGRTASFRNLFRLSSSGSEAHYKRRKVLQKQKI